MTTLEDLYKAILANPDEDTPRLMYADALDETDEPANHERAKFIRAQFRLRDIGPRRRVVETGRITSKGGYYCFTGGIGDELKVGDRVDVHLYRHGLTRERHGRKVGDGVPVLAHGLVVARIVPDNILGGATEVYAKGDEYSAPYPAEERQKLQEYCACRIVENGPSWAPGWQECDWAVRDGPMLVPSGVETGTARASLVFSRGFGSDVWARWDWWADHGDPVVASLPITDVRFPYPPPALKVTPLPEDRLVRYELMTDSSGYMLMSRSEHELRVDLKSAEDAIRRKLLKERWPSVARWTWA